MKNLFKSILDNRKKKIVEGTIICLMFACYVGFKNRGESHYNGNRTSIIFDQVPLEETFQLLRDHLQYMELDAFEQQMQQGQEKEVFNNYEEEFENNSDKIVYQNSIEKRQIDSFNEELLVLINDLRANKGVEPLTYDPILQYDADIRAKEGTILRGHERPDENGNPSGLYPDSISGNVVGENLAYSNAPDKYSVSSAYEAWCASTKGHYEAMFNSKYHTMAVSVFTAENGNVCWALVFGN